MAVESGDSYRSRYASLYLMCYNRPVCYTYVRIKTHCRTWIGLLQVLRQLELRTGVKVTEIFDWIVGTSTGGILALGLVYGQIATHIQYITYTLTAKKNLSELRQLYFKLRDRVFSASRMGIGYNTESFEQVLKEEFGTVALMSDETHPKLATQLTNIRKCSLLQISLVVMIYCTQDSHNCGIQEDEST